MYKRKILSCKFRLVLSIVTVLEVEVTESDFNDKDSMEATFK